MGRPVEDGAKLTITKMRIVHLPVASKVTLTSFSVSLSLTLSLSLSLSLSLHGNENERTGWAGAGRRHLGMREGHVAFRVTRGDARSDEIQRTVTVDLV